MAFNPSGRGPVGTERNRHPWQEKSISSNRSNSHDGIARAQPTCSICGHARVIPP